MKKILLTLCFLGTLFTAAFAADGAEKKQYKVDDFKGISVGGATELTIVKGDKYALSIEVYPDYHEYVKLSYTKDGILEIGYKTLPFKMRNSKKSHMKVEATVPTLNGCYISGASHLVCEDVITPASEMGTFVLECSGASSVEKMNVKAAKMEIDVSGASKAIVDGVFGELSVDASSASKVELSGETGELELEVSSASTVDAEKLSADYVDAEVSSASKALVSVNNKLTVEISSASSLVYSAKKDIVIDIKKVSGASSIKNKNE